MKIKLNRGILSVLLFSLLLLMFSAGTFLVRDIVKSGLGLDQSISPGILFLVYSIQSIFLIFSFLVSIKYYFGKGDFKNKLKSFLGESLQSPGIDIFFKYISLGFGLYFLVSIVLRLITMRLGVDIPGLFGQQQSMLLFSNINLITIQDYIIVFFMIVLLGPVIEEVIFRGFVTKILLREMKIGYGIFCSSLIFTIIHFERSVFFNILLLAGILSRIYYKTKSIIVTLGFHILVNLIGFLGMLVLKNLPSIAG